MADWDTNNPSDSDIVSQYPANERAARAAVRTNFGIDHHETDDADVGKHEVIQIVDNGADPTIAAGQAGIWNNGGVLKTRVGAGTASEMAQRGELNAPAGTKMIFFQASAPTGWTQDTAVNDRVLKVVSGTGGGTGGSWTITGVTVDNHAITAGEMPVHNHGGLTGGRNPNTDTAGGHVHGIRLTDSDSGGITSSADSGNNGAASFVAGAIETAGAHSHTVNFHDHTIPSDGNGNGHNHGLTADGTWRPSHIDVIAASKD